MMRKRWKKGVAAILSAALMIGSGIPVTAASAGWRKDVSGWRYVNSDGSYRTGWVQDKDGRWYFMDYHTGIMKTGWIKPRDGKWYFLDYHNGDMKTGWIKLKDGKWYFMDYNNGDMKTGWIKPRDGKWYFMDYHSGGMLTGWIKPRDGKWYYLDTGSGVMQTGNITIGGKMWSLNSDGVWNGASATNSDVTYVSSGGSSGGGSSSSVNNWITSADQSIRVNKRTREVEILKGGTDQNPVICDKNAVNKLSYGVADRISKLTISSAVADGTVVLDGLTVDGNTIVEGGGSSSVKFTNCTLRSPLVAKKAKEANPLHLLFGAGTLVNRVEIEGGNVILTLNINIGTIYTKSSVVLKGTGKVDTFEIAADVNTVLADQVQAGQVKTAAGVKPKVEVEKNAKVDAVAGDAVFTGDGQVKEYYDIVLHANGGYWEVKTLNDQAGETTEKLSTQVLKAKKGETAANVLTAAGVGNPVRENAVFAGWYESADTKDAVDLTKVVMGEKNVDFTAKWNITAVEPEVRTITATISGSSITGTVKDKMVEWKVATGGAVGAVGDAGVAVGGFTAQVFAADGTEVKGTVTCSSDTVKVGQTFEVVFTPEDKEKYLAVTIKAVVLADEN